MWFGFLDVLACKKKARGVFVVSFRVLEEGWFWHVGFIPCFGLFGGFGFWGVVLFVVLWCGPPPPAPRSGFQTQSEDRFSLGASTFYFRNTPDID